MCLGKGVLLNDKRNIRKELIKAGVSDYLYNLSVKGRIYERLCLKKRREVVCIFSERGIKTMNVVFDNEDEACLFLYNQLIN